VNQEQLIEQYFRLKRKLSASYGAWHSGRIDHLAAALQSVERELCAHRPEAGPAGHMAFVLRLHPNDVNVTGTALGQRR